MTFKEWLGLALARGVDRPSIDRFNAKVQTAGECLEWSGSLHGQGYGQFLYQGRLRLAHHLLYEWLHGPTPPGPEKMAIDHLCANKRCVRPEHLELVTQSENAKRHFRSIKTCLQGHPLSGENLRKNQRQRVCRLCARKWEADYRERRRVAK